MKDDSDSDTVGATVGMFPVFPTTALKYIVIKSDGFEPKFCGPFDTPEDAWNWVKTWPRTVPFIYWSVAELHQPVK